jgi:hypothetical protein
MPVSFLSVIALIGTTLNCLWSGGCSLSRILGFFGSLIGVGGVFVCMAQLCQGNKKAPEGASLG